MTTVHVTKKHFWDNDVEGYVFLLPENFKLTSDLHFIEDNFYPHAFKVLKRHRFTGKKGQSFVLTAPNGSKLIQLFFYGLGTLDGKWNDELERLRRAIGSCVNHMKKRQVHNAVMALPPTSPFGVDRAELAKQMTIAIHLASYEFITFKTEKKDKKWKGSITLVDTKPAGTAVKKGVSQGNVIGDAVNKSRELGNLPGNVATPTYLANHAKKIAKDHGLKCTVFGRSKAKELGMGGFCAVDAGSEQPGKFVILEYHASAKNAPTIALVGKGITFDTGGISLKPSLRMKGMKYDMSGAAAVMGAMDAIGKLKPSVNVVAVAPCVENMPGGGAGRQDDIITFMNGRTAEIESTDAEGRLVLADALHYTEKNFKPDIMVDAATLTGAMVHCLGHYFTGLMSQDDKLVAQLQKAGTLTGDRVWPLPQDDDFKPAVIHEAADLTNTANPGYGAGSITASWFLKHFVEKTPWAHLDIAGTADNVPGISYLGKGSAGAAVRLLVEFVQSYKK